MQATRTTYIRAIIACPWRESKAAMPIIKPAILYYNIRYGFPTRKKPCRLRQERAFEIYPDRYDTREHDRRRMAGRRSKKDTVRTAEFQICFESDDLIASREKNSSSPHHALRRMPSRIGDTRIFDHCLHARRSLRNHCPETSPTILSMPFCMRPKTYWKSDGREPV